MVQIQNNAEKVAFSTDQEPVQNQKEEKSNTVQRSNWAFTGQIATDHLHLTKIQN